MNKYHPEQRKWPRLVPANAVMVSIYSGGSQAYGLIANVSLAGACIASGVHFRPGSKVLLRIGFELEGNPFVTEARVIWTRDETRSGGKPTFVHGVAFHMESEQHRTELRSILSRPDFHQPVIPGKPAAGSDLDTLLVDLGDELDELATRIAKKSETR